MQSRSMNLSSWLRSLALFWEVWRSLADPYFGKWTYLWKEWLTSVDHKRLGIMYIIVAIVMLLRGFADAIMMRSQQALASAGEAGFLPPHHYDQIFTAHGVIMIFFVAMPFVIGLMNWWFRCRSARVTLRSRSSTT